jgi:hypothetical protein
MTTKSGKPLAASQTTHEAEMPPLEVVTEGIPPMEHIEPAPAAQVEPPAPVARDRWDRMWAWALAGVMGLLLLVAGVFAVTQYSSTGDPDLTVVPPVGSDVGVPASEPVYAGGYVLPEISSLSIPAIPSIPDVSIAQIPAIPPLPAMSIPSIPDLSIPAMSIPDLSMPDISIPPFPGISIPEISIPTFTGM